MVVTRFACCRPNSFHLLMGHTKQPIFAIVPNLVPVQLHGQPPELLLQFLRSRNVAILDPSRSSLQSHVGDLSRRSADSCFLILHRLFQHCRYYADKVLCQVRPGSPTRDVLLPEPIWHETHRLHQSNAWPRINLTAEKLHFLMDSLQRFVMTPSAISKS